MITFTGNRKSSRNRGRRIIESITGLETNLNQLAKGTREGKDEMQLLKDNLTDLVKKEAADSKALDEFNAKLE